MRNHSLIKMFALSFVSILAIPMVLFYAWAADAKECDFKNELRTLISEQDSTYFFKEIQLAIGSNSFAVDDRIIEMDVAPEIQNCRTMLPIRPLLEAMGAVVEYKDSTVFIATKDGDHISCRIGEPFITVNGEKREIDSSAYLKSQHTYFPVRAIAEAINLNVVWNQETYTVTITAPYQTARILVMAEETHDFSSFAVEKKLYDGNGMWILQFKTPSMAKKAVESLLEEGLIAEPDQIITLQAE